jgi:chromate reductase, NAD(P)H dehydrogenase (quinone)
MESSNRQPVQFLVFGASVREGSFNKRLAELAADAITANGGEADLADMADFCAEAYSQDAQNETGFPAPIEVMRDRITANDAFVIACPEYNASMPGSLKNSIDWVSRFSPQPFNERHGLLMSASPSMVGGNRGLWALRVPLEHLGARVYPDMFSLAQAHQALGDRRLLDNERQDRFERTIVAFMDLVEASKHYPCAKTKWVEYLGERPDPILDRVE